MEPMKPTLETPLHYLDGKNRFLDSETRKKHSKEQKKILFLELLLLPLKKALKVNFFHCKCL